jgi:hypothetical protein
LKAFQHFALIHLKTQLELPPLENLKRLKGKDSLQGGMWILLVRVPRPFSAKVSIPLSRRKLERFASETEEEFLARVQDMKRRSDSEKHPTEDQLYLTRNQTLLQGVAKNVVCTKCGAKGHHHEKTHDDVYAPVPVKFPGVCYERRTPAFMNVLPYPMEEIQLTKMISDDKGFTLSIRETSTKVPLRLARKLLLDGLHIEGQIHASGVGKRRRILHDAEDELARASAEAKRSFHTDLQAPQAQGQAPQAPQAPASQAEAISMGVHALEKPLVFDMSEEWEVDRRFHIESYIQLAREYGFKEEANQAAKKYLDSLDSRFWKPLYLLES